MNLQLVVLTSVLLLVSGCGDRPSQAQRQLKTIWRAKNVSVAKRCSAINACFTNGTPMHNVLAVLGQPDTMLMTTSMGDPPNQRVLLYRFGLEAVMINSSGDPETHLNERGFAGAEIGAFDSYGHPLGRTEEKPQK